MIANRITTGWKLSGTKNFRLASAKMLSYYGANLQNPSPSLMQCIIPDEGKIFLQGDQAGAEALIVAYECRRAKFRKLFELGVKPHSYTALQIFTEKFKGGHPSDRYKGVDPEVIVTYPEYKELFKTLKNSEREYKLGKMVRHAKNYNMGPRTFQVNCLEQSEGEIVLSFKEAKDFLGIDDTVFPEIAEYHAIINAKLAADRTLHNLFGYPRYFSGLWSDSLKRDAYAFIPQSTVGTITNLAFVELHHKIQKEHLPWQVLNNKHDSVLIQVPDTSEHVESGAAVLKGVLERELVSSRGEHYKMKAEIAKGYNWAKWHETNNPDGMKEFA